jgi:hypothetical protein
MICCMTKRRLGYFQERTGEHELLLSYSSGTAIIVVYILLFHVFPIKVRELLTFHTFFPSRSTD